MKNTFKAITLGFFALVIMSTSMIMSSCNKDIVQPTQSTQALEIKSVLDSVADAQRAPELVMSLDEITLALNNEHPMQIAQRSTCNKYVFERIVAGETSRQSNINTVLSYLGIFGTSVSSIDPRDVNNDQTINMSDFLVCLSVFGTSFDHPEINAVETVGGEVSGTGELAMFTGTLTIDGDEVDLIEIFPNSNCFVQDYTSDEYDPEACYDAVKLTFETTAGNAKYFFINQ